MFIYSQDRESLINSDGVRRIGLQLMPDMAWRLIGETSDYVYTLGEYKSREDAKYALEQIVKQIGTAEIPKSDTCRKDAYTLEECGEYYWTTPEMAKAIAAAYEVKTLGELADEVCYSSKGWDDFPKLTKEVVKGAEKLLVRMGYMTENEIKEEWEDPENEEYWVEKERKLNDNA